MLKNLFKTLKDLITGTYWNLWYTQLRPQTRHWMWHITACLLRRFWLRKSVKPQHQQCCISRSSVPAVLRIYFKEKKKLISPENIEKISTTIPSCGFNHLERIQGVPQRIQLVCKWGRLNHPRLAAPLHFIRAQLHRVPTSRRQLWDGSDVCSSALVQWLFWINEIDQKWNSFRGGLLFLHLYLLIQ